MYLLNKCGACSKCKVWHRLSAKVGGYRSGLNPPELLMDSLSVDETILNLDD